MKKNILPVSQPTPRANTTWWIWVVMVIVIVAAGAVYLYWSTPKAEKNNLDATITNQTIINTNIVATVIEMPAKVLANKFGWLGGGAGEDNPFVGDAGGAWVRPHPGPFLWDAMQASATAEISFANTDALVQDQQRQGYGTLATLWPFADWDQQGRTNYADCAVSQQDEFLAKNDSKGRGDYLSLYRCNPVDWEKYATWVAAVVERYDGDGVNDMPGLVIPIKYWEVMNEPDLRYQFTLRPGEVDTLNFYKQGPAEYATLLVNTNTSIKSADSQAQVLIAGAAGADPRMLNFYRQVFNNTVARTAFDIGNVHCISNDRSTHDFNVGSYKSMLTEFGLSLPIWVTEAEAFYGSTATENYTLTKTSTAGAITAGASRIFYTRYNFDDFRTDMSKTNGVSDSSMTDSQNKYLSITSLY